MHHHNDYLNPELANKRVSVLGGKRMLDIKRGLNTMMGRESMLVMDDVSACNDYNISF